MRQRAHSVLGRVRLLLGGEQMKQLVAVLAVVGLIACSGEQDAQGTGSIELSIRGPGAAAADVLSNALFADASGEPDARSRIKSVWVSVESDDAGYYGEFERVQLVDGGAFPIAFTRTKLFAGRYTVSAYAYDGVDGGTTLYEVSASVVVSDRKISVVELIMQQVVAPGTVHNTAPVVEAITITGTWPPVIGKPVHLEATVSASPTPTYAWTVWCVTDPAPYQPLSTPNAIATDLTLNQCESGAVVTFSVTDPSVPETGGSMTSTVSLVLPYVKQGVEIPSITLNSWPNIVSLRATTNAQPKPGESVTFRASAVDPDGGTISDYRWSADCAGEDDGELAPPGLFLGQTEWTAPAEGGTCVITVAVTDGEGGANSATLTLKVGSVWTMMPALWPNSSATGSTIEFLDEGTVRLTKVDSDTAPNLSFVGEPQFLTSLSYDVDGYCGAGAPRFNVRFEGSNNLYWFACYYGTADEETTTVRFVPADAWRSGSSERGVLASDLATPIRSIGIVMDEVGTVTLSNIEVNGSPVLH
jgi:hypothetical protein